MTLPRIQPVTLPTVGFVRLKKILEVYPVSPRTWWQGVKDGEFPAPVKLRPKVTAWHAADIWALLERAGAKAS